MGVKHLNRGMSWALVLVVLASMVVLPAAGYAETDSDSNTVYFDPAMIQLLDVSASDFTKTEDMRALLSVILSLEFSNQETGYEYDFTNPIYVAINQLDLVTVALGVEDGYVCIFYSDLTDPITTAYTFLDTTSSRVMQLVLEENNKSVWEVSLSDYYKQAKTLNDALNS